jgi:asparagine synthase (glutamine-hydrolysing)
MCGIAGFVDLQTARDSTALKRVVKDMTDSLSHRGPDSEGAWVDETAGMAFGHRRLAILDLTAEGHQPMLSACGRYVITYNGEIYNFQELRARLEAAGHGFKGTSDTEVLLAAIAAWGLEKTLRESNGMFAFALWDRQEKTLSLARDRMGKKPLYYGWAGRNLVFSSELKAFHRHPEFSPRVSRDVLALYCRYNYVPAPWSIFEGIYKLSPASFVSLSLAEGKALAPGASLREREQKYWDLRAVAEAGSLHPAPLSESEALEQLDDLLTGAVGRRMVSDVPLGAFLSGGIDSSLVAALMQKQSARPVKTFCIGFEEAGFNEAKYAKEIARHLGTDHTEFYVTADEARNVIPSLADIYDEPFADSSQIPMFHVARLARQHVTVALSGDGGDESFAGYSRYAFGQKAARSFLWLPAGLRGAAAELIGAVPGTPSKIATLYRLLKVKDRAELYWMMMSYWRGAENPVLNGRDLPVAMTGRDFLDGKGSFVDAMAYADMAAYLPDDILVKVDRATMAVSLEARAPLLDYKVIEYAWSLPPTMKMRGGEGKHILRTLLKRYVPADLVERPKQGFGIPQAQWLRGPLREWAQEFLDEGRLAREGYFDPAPITRKWREHLSGRKDWSYQLWGLLMFEEWHERWLGPSAGGGQQQR